MPRMPSTYAQRKRAEQPARPDNRPSPSARGYDRRWRTIRNRFIAAHPLCAHCLEQGVVQPASEVDHKVPIRRGGTHDESNLQALCKPCHSRKTAREDGAFGHGPA